MYSGPIINIHTHLRLTDDLEKRVNNWRKWKMLKVVCLMSNARRRYKGYFTNDDFLRMENKYADIIVPFASVNLLASQMDQPDRIDYFKEKGFLGLKFEDNSYPYNHEIYWPLYERVERLRLPILFHVGNLAHVGVIEGVNRDKRDGIDGENMRPYRLDKVARSFPGLTMVGAHLGDPHYNEAIELMGDYSNLFFDFSGGCGAKPWVRRITAALMPPLPGSKMDDPQENPALDLFAKKLVFGTDNPEPDIWVPASEFIMDTLQIPEIVRENFYYRTAARILGFKN